MAQDKHEPPPPEVLSPEVEALMVRRDAAGSLKKILESLTAPVESTIKARVKLSKAEESTREAAQCGFEKAIEKLDAALADAAQLAAVVDDAEGVEWQKV